MVVVKDVIHRVEFEQKDINLFYSIYADSDANASEFKITAFRSQSEADSQQIVNQIIITVKEYSDEEPASSSFEVYYINNVENVPKYWSSHKIVKGLSKETFAARIKEIFEEASMKTWSKSVFGEYVTFSVPSAVL